MIRRTAAFIALACFLTLGACGGGDSTNASPTARTVDPGQAMKVDAVPNSAPFIDQDSLTFKPGSLTVANGQAVFFKDSESAIHTVTVNGKNLSGTMKPGDIISWTPPAAGIYKITCDYHPQMRSTITVDGGNGAAAAPTTQPK